MKKITVLAVAAMALAGVVFSSCSKKSNKFKVGVIYIGDENEGYTEAHMNGVKAMKEALKLDDDQVIEKTLIPEDEKCLDAAKELLADGCNFIIGTSFGHEPHLLTLADENPNVQFAHSTGFNAGNAKNGNLHNFMPSVYQSRYVSGVVAGLKLNEMLANGDISYDEVKIGYVGAYPYAEVVSGYTAFFLGARSVCPFATMEVRYTNSWADQAKEKEQASALIANGCVLISQHADTTGAPSACEAAGVPCVGYNVDMIATAPNCALTSAALNWGAYYTSAVKAVMEGTELPKDWSEGYNADAVYITPLNEKAVAPRTKEVVDATIEGIKAGTIHPFATSSFTVGGDFIETLIATDEKFAETYSKYVKDGYFHEQELASAPAFDLRIDGITENN